MQNIKIPQNVQIEDKLVGPLSLRQLLLVALGGGFSYALYASIHKSVGYVPVTAHMFIWLPGILSVAFALIRINDLSLFRCLLLVIETMSKPRERPFLPRQGIVINIQTRGGRKQEEAEDTPKEQPPLVVSSPTPKAPEQLTELTRLLDRRGRGEVRANPLTKNIDSVRVHPSV